MTTYTTPYPDQDTACRLHEQVIDRLHAAARTGHIDEKARDAMLADFTVQFDRDTSAYVRVAVATRWMHRVEGMEGSRA